VVQEGVVEGVAAEAEVRQRLSLPSRQQESPMLRCLRSLSDYGAIAGFPWESSLDLAFDHQQQRSRSANNKRFKPDETKPV
jgi:hypothetical protein